MRQREGHTVFCFCFFANLFLCCFRLQALEKWVFIENGDLPTSVCDIQTRVAEFKNKLQVRFYVVLTLTISARWDHPHTQGKWSIHPHPMLMINSLNQGSTYPLPEKPTTHICKNPPPDWSTNLCNQWLPHASNLSLCQLTQSMPINSVDAVNLIVYQLTLYVPINYVFTN